MDDTEVHFKDFTKKRKPVRFAIDPDVFECAVALTPDALQEIVSRFRSEDFVEAREARDVDRVMKGVREIFEIFLLDPKTYAKFVSRLGDKKNPIDIHQLLEIVHWVIGIYTDRPTQPSPSSSSGSESDDGGISLTAGAPSMELIPLP
jgi:hypothetical protein